VDLRQHLGTLKRWIPLAVVGALVGGFLAYTLLSVQPRVYETSATLKLVQPLSGAPILLTPVSDRLLTEYAYRGTSRGTLDAVAESQELEQDATELQTRVGTEVQPSSALLTITARGNSPEEAAALAEWLCHHMAIGVDHFFLYDNGSTDELHEVLKPFADHGVVTTVYFPLRGLQRDANNHVIRFFGDTAEWIAYVDIDEFLVPEHDEPISVVMARYPEAEQVLVSRKEFCYSGQRTPVEGLVTETYREYSEQVPRMGTSEILAKPIVRPRGVARVGIHNALTLHGRTVNTAGDPTSEEATVIESPSYAILQMNHYFTKSWQEFQAKRTRATTSTHAFQLPDVPFDIPGQVDHVIDRWQPRTRALMDEMRLLARSPSRFGSKLRLRGFPINDLFGQEANAITSNEVAGVPEARKKPAFRGLPLPGVRGAMVRAEDHGYEPAPGRFQCWPPNAPEMARLEAQVTSALAGGEPPHTVEDGPHDMGNLPEGR
jgi:hypothetical protein